MRKTFQNIYQLVDVHQEQVPGFLDASEDMLNIRFPQEYLDRARSYAFQNGSGQLCGCVMVVEKPPFRSLLSVPLGTRAQAMAQLGSLEGIAEVNGVWIAPEFRLPSVSFSFWHQLISILLGSANCRFLFTVDQSNQHMLDHVGVLDPEVVYAGETQLVDGMKTQTSESVLMVHRRSLPAVMELLERRGIGKARPMETELIQRIGSRKRRSRILPAIDSSGT